MVIVASGDDFGDGRLLMSWWWFSLSVIDWRAFASDCTVVEWLKIIVEKLDKYTAHLFCVKISQDSSETWKTCKSPLSFISKVLLIDSG